MSDYSSDRNQLLTDIAELRKANENLERRHHIDQQHLRDAGLFVAAAMRCGYTDINQQDALCYALARCTGETEPIVLRLLVSIMNSHGHVGSLVRVIEDETPVITPQQNWDLY